MISIILVWCIFELTCIYINRHEIIQLSFYDDGIRAQSFRASDFIF